MTKIDQILENFPRELYIQTDAEVVLHGVKQALKKEMLEAVGDEEEPNNIAHPFYLEELDNIRSRNKTRAEIRQRIEEIFK